MPGREGDAGPPRVAHERLEADARAEWYEAASAAVKGSRSPRVARSGGAVALAIAGTPVPFPNRVLGLGLAEPATEAQLDELLGAYRGLGVPFTVQPSAFARPAELPAWIEARGGRPWQGLELLWRDASPPAPARTDLRVERVSPDRALEFGRALARGFGAPEGSAPFHAATVGRPGWSHYAALDGDEIVAAALMLVRGEGAWVGGAATLEAHRGRGAQGALLAVRVRDAVAAGCAWLGTETEAAADESPNGSFRNMVRAGFRHYASRMRFLFKPA